MEEEIENLKIENSKFVLNMHYTVRLCFLTIIMVRI